MPLGHRKTKHITVAKHLRTCMLGNHFYEKYSHTVYTLCKGSPVCPLCLFLLLRQTRRVKVLGRKPKQLTTNM